MSTVGLSYPKTSEIEYEEFVNIVLKNFKELDWIFSGKLDFKNIQAEGITTKNLKAEAITADKIKAGTITAAQIAADSITANEIAANAITATEINADAVEADKIKAGAVTADKIDVNQLSAITADLGTIVAGVIYGAYIATANGAYPRVELSNTVNLLQASTSVSNYLQIDADLTNPSLVFVNSPLTAVVNLETVPSPAWGISANTDIRFGIGGKFTVNSSSGSIPDVVAAINGKANAFSGFTGSFSTGTQTVNVVNGIITSVI